ncbi:uncharacterized protein ATNIH1004_009225 [Aspergillus tanneri]|uniref:Uncharacterized protein n=1 Tax=Aspergillus tanneri TaxID=1220188 RepID=A0A5M9MI50_9EURO|nr:uncharacterized protein ATNIH1004_009225 [Aspergillus tanneri]KAA8645014.1 hypothetical protein ATNIH1004_009225 [Aspergillus tanneri]
MAKSALFIILLLVRVQCAAGALADLSDGFCRSYKFGTSVANDILYLIDLDGGLIPGDGDASNNYLVQLDLTQEFYVNNGSHYKMSLVPSNIPKLKDQALWSSQDNATLFAYGGRGIRNTSSDNGIWTYKPQTRSWSLQQTGIIAVRRLGGAYVNAPAIQSAFWLGGYQSSDTTETITDESLHYLDKMIKLNTTTGQVTEVSALSNPVQQGALVYIPVGELGILVFMGGEVPSDKTGVDLTYTPVTPHEPMGKNTF